jgi:tetratricopeptide (TPR) repeat protein
MRVEKLLGIMAAAFLLLATPALAGQAATAKDALAKGKAAVEKDNPDAAIAAFTEAIRLDPKMAEAYYCRARVLSDKNENAKAIADYSQAVKLNPKYAEAWCNRGREYAVDGQVEKALADLAEAIKINPKLLPAYQTRGWVYSENGAYEKAAADYTEAIRLDPKDGQTYADRAVCYSYLKKYKEAIADLDAAIKLDVKDPKVIGLRGSANLYLGNYSQGIADMKEAIRLNPGDLGAKYQPSSKKELPAEAIKHGEEQVSRMLRDRPAMAQYGEEIDFLRQWAARKFAGEDFGEPLDWDPTPPKDSEAENVAPTGGRRACIRVTEVDLFGPKKDRKFSFEELWEAAIFELHNVTYSKKYLQFHQDAAAGKLTKKEFVGGIWKTEYLAVQRTRAFYVQVYLPWAEKKKLPTDPRLWFDAWWDTADEVMEGFVDKSLYPWRPYARQFDWLQLDKLQRGGKYQEALKLLGEMEKEKVYTADPVDTADLYYWIGRCQMELGKPAPAIEALGKSIAADPKKAQSYQLRSEAYKKAGDEAKSQADAAKAKQLGAGTP